MRVVLDVSLLIQGCLGEYRYLRDKYELGNEISWSTETEPEVRVFSRASAGMFSIIVSEPLIAEWEDVRRRPRWNGQFLGERGNAIDAVLHGPESILVELDEIKSVCRDPKDDYLIATAVAGHADHLVSADKDLIDLAKYEGIAIVNAATFLRKIEQMRSP